MIVEEEEFMTGNNPGDKERIRRSLKRVIRSMVREGILHGDPEKVRHIPYPSPICAACHVRVGTVTTGCGLAPKNDDPYNDPDHIWIDHMLCEECKRLLKQPAHTQMIGDKVGDTLTFWLLTYDRKWGEA